MKEDTLKKTEHCCMMMDTFVNDPRVMVYYDSILRDYSIYRPTNGTYDCIDYCPWCASKLPADLEDEYKKILKNEYHIEDPYSDEADDLIPDEFQSDEWWKKRGL